MVLPILAAAAAVTLARSASAWAPASTENHVTLDFAVPTLIKTDDIAAVPVPRTFGNGVLSSVHNPPRDGGAGSSALVVLNHTLHGSSAYGVMTHYWSTGEVVNWDTVVDYYVDGEETPSVSLMEDMACGQGFPKAEFGTFNGNGTPWHGEAPAGRSGLFAAGEKMGKGGQIGGYYHYHKASPRPQDTVPTPLLPKRPALAPTHLTHARHCTARTVIARRLSSSRRALSRHCRQFCCHTRIPPCFRSCFRGPSGSKPEASAGTRSCTLLYVGTKLRRTHPLQRA